MDALRLGDFEIVERVAGARRPLKASYPVHYGTFCQVGEGPYRCRFLPSGAVKYLWGHGERHWPHPGEWLKHTLGDDWIYYSAGDYEGLFSLYGEHQLPCPAYPSNSPLDPRPFADERVRAALEWFASLPERLGRLAGRAPPRLAATLEAISRHTPAGLARRARRLHDICGGRLAVLPPEARHLDYDVVPLTVADGCLYGCRFCCLESPGRLRPRSPDDVADQLERLRRLLGADLPEYAGVFAGNHDGLAAGWELVVQAARRAWEVLELAGSHLAPRLLVLFASADALLSVSEEGWRQLAALPFQVHVNIGLESAHPEILERLGKPLTPARVERALARLLEINQRFVNLEISANFVLPPEPHLLRLQEQSLVETLRRLCPRRRSRGAVYLSPLLPPQGPPARGFGRRRLIDSVGRLKLRCPLPVFLYLIQGL